MATSYHFDDILKSAQTYGTLATFEIRWYISQKKKKEYRNVIMLSSNTITSFQNTECHDALRITHGLVICR